MKGDSDIIESLNEILTSELTAVNQYYVHAKMCENWGYKRLAAHLRNESIEEMKHADMLIERILYFEGIPNMQLLNPVKVGEDVPEQHKLDLDLEKEAVARLNNTIAFAAKRTTTAPAKSSRTCCARRRRPSTGPRHNSASSRRSGRETTWRSRSTSRTAADRNRRRHGMLLGDEV